MEHEKDRADLRRAVEVLEYPTFADQVSNQIGKPVAYAVHALPNHILSKIERLANTCLSHAFEIVLSTINTKKSYQKSRNGLHRTLVAMSGAAGGFLGGLSLAVELPLSTGIIMRSIADIAREEGEDLASAESRIACLQVLALNTTDRNHVPADTGVYFHIRWAMASVIQEATTYLMAGQVTEQSAPAMLRLLSTISERFGIQLTEKVALEWMPVVSAVTAGGLNLMFMSHFQRIARGHFIIRRLERTYGTEHVYKEYQLALQDIEKERRRAIFPPAKALAL